MLSSAAIDSDQLFSTFDLASRSSVIAAVSGGSDSTALLLLLKDHLDRFAPATRLVAATVDHALRPASADEARDVARLCERLSIEHVILPWLGDKPATGLAAAAREARYDLLAAVASAQGTDLLLTGHTANDQAETVLMRSGREAGRGLAGMAPATLYASAVWIVRPLLKIRRDGLRASLRQRGIGWIDDPTNRDNAYERSRIRASLGVTGGEQTLRDALATAKSAAIRRKALGEQAAGLIASHARRPVPGLIGLDQEFFHADSEAAVYALRILLATVGGTPHLPDANRSADLFTRLRAEKPLRGVLSRTLIDRRRAGVFLLREARDVPKSAALHVGMIWDGRYRMVAGSGRGKRPLPNRESISDPEPVGGQGRVTGKTASANPGSTPASLVRAAAGAEPVLPSGNDGSSSWQAVPLVAPWARFLPSFDLVPANAVAALIGGPAIPASPWPEHNRRKA